MKLLLIFIIISSFCFSQNKLNNKEEYHIEQIKSLSKLIQEESVNETYWGLYAERSFHKYHIGDNIGAISDCELIFKNPSSNLDVCNCYNHIANSNFNLKEYYKAIEYWNKALNCDDLEYSKKEIYYNLGSAHINIGNNKKGCLYYTKSGELGYQKAYDALYDFCH